MEYNSRFKYQLLLLSKEFHNVENIFVDVIVQSTDQWNSNELLMN